MASLMEEFITTLEEENKGYATLAELAGTKTQAIVHADLKGLQDITEQEQLVMGQLMTLEKKRLAVRKEMARVLQVPEETLTLLSMANMFEKKPEEKQKLMELRERLRLTLIDVAKVNKENEALLKQSMDMLEFDMNLVKSMRQSPTTANYTKNAYCTYDTLPGSGFDVKR